MTSPSTDQQRWDARYQGGSIGRVVPFIAEILEQLPTHGRALDLAGGSGATALALAERGFDVTLVDVSAVALDIAGREAADRGVSLDCRHIDLTVEPIPDGPWDLMVCANYLDRSLMAPMVSRLVPGGLLAIVIATVTNLERNDRPSRNFLVERGEVGRLLADLDPMVDVEGWFGGRHEARFLGARSGR